MEKRQTANDNNNVSYKSYPNVSWTITACQLKMHADLRLYTATAIKLIVANCFRDVTGFLMTFVVEVSLFNFNFVL